MGKQIMSSVVNFTNINPVSKKENLKIKKDIYNIIKKKTFILGDEVRVFEKSFAKMSKNKYAVGCANGTDALLLSLMSLNLENDDEIIVPGLTYISTGLSVILNNNKLILVDVDRETALIDIKKIKEKITKKTKAIIPVNLYGQKVNLNKLRREIGKKIHIIEDSAQSHFAFHENSNKTSKNNNALASCYSFYPAKNMGAYGDAGLITTNNRSIYNKLLSLRNLGSVKKHKHNILGMNSRLDTIQAVVLKNKLKSILKFNQNRRRIGTYYDKKLAGISEIQLTKTNRGSTRHLYVIKTKKRDKLKKYLSNQGIFCQLHYPYSLNKLPAFKKKIKETVLKNSELWAKQCLSLPMHPKLTEIEVDKIAKKIKIFFKYK